MKPSMSHWVRRGLLVGATALAGAALWVTVLRPTSVRTVPLEVRDVVSALAVVGRVRASARAELGASLGATVREVRVREGESVASGDVLIVLEDREARAAVSEAEAALAETRATSAQSISEAQREADLAARDLERIQTVFGEGGLTQQRVDQAVQRAADATSRLEALQVSLSANDGVPVSVRRSLANLEAARARLDLTRIRAPAAGVVLSRQVEPGDAVAPGRVLLQVAFDGPTELVAYPGEENLAVLRPGLAATVSADAFPDVTFAAVLATVAPAVDPAQGTVEVRLRVPEPPDYLRPDMTVSINVETGRVEGASVLPDDVVQGLATDEPWVGVIVDGRFERRAVQLGFRGGGWVEIVSGVQAGEGVVADAQGLSEGDRVRIVTDAPS